MFQATCWKSFNHPIALSLAVLMDTVSGFAWSESNSKWGFGRLEITNIASKGKRVVALCFLLNLKYETKERES